MSDIHRSDLHDAELERRSIGEIVVTRPVAAWFAAAICAGLVSVAAVDLVRAARAETGEDRVPGPAAFARRLSRAFAAGRRTGDTPVARMLAGNRAVLREMDALETDMEDGSILRSSLVPVSAVARQAFGLGNEQVVTGRDDWLFYAPGIRHLAGPAFLDPRTLARRRRAAEEWEAPPHPDPVAAIVGFHGQLAARGIDLVIVPAPTKAAVHPEHLAGRAPTDDALPANRSWAEFLRRVADADVAVVDPLPLLVDRARTTGQPQYLRADSHWTPDAVETVAAAVADRVRDRVESVDDGFGSMAAEVTQRGDLAGMLRLPDRFAARYEESVRVREATAPGGAIWRPDPTAEVLVLGDSFTNIYAAPSLGWGENGGLAERISAALGAPVDRIARNDNGASATRLALARELARGRDRLAGKRVVVWEFAARELSFGDWVPVDLKIGEPVESSWYSPEPGTTREITATVVEVAPVPRPGTVPYRDHIVAMTIADLAGDGLPADAADAYLFTWGLRHDERADGARIGPGDRVRFRVRPWADVSAERDAINRTELDDDELLLVDPVWGEILP